MVMDADGVEPSLNARITARQFQNAITKMRLYAQAIFSPVLPVQESFWRGSFHMSILQTVRGPGFGCVVFPWTLLPRPVFKKRLAP